MIYKLGERVPKIPEHSCFIAENAIILGQVTLGERCSVWYNAVLRADDDEIIVGNGTNIQDGAILHCDAGFPILLGENVTIGHKAMLHGCIIGENSLIGINAVVLNGANIGKNCLIGANALVKENMEVPDGSMLLGTPARIDRMLTAEQQEALKFSALHYQAKIGIYRKQLSKV